MQRTSRERVRMSVKGKGFENVCFQIVAHSFAKLMKGSSLDVGSFAAIVSRFAVEEWSFGPHCVRKACADGWLACGALGTWESIARTILVGQQVFIGYSKRMGRKETSG